MKYIYLYLFFTFQLILGQTNFSDQWQDLYSYNDVKDFVIVENNLYAITNNAMFIYNIESNKTDKFSSINGLSGFPTSSIFYDKTSESIIIGYENGLIEVVLKDNQVIPITGVRDNSILVNKTINGCYRYQNQLYVFGDYGISELNIENFEIGDTFKLNNSDTSNFVNQILVDDNVFYAATNDGLFKIDISSNLVGFNSWTQVENGNIENLISLNETIYYAKKAGVYEVSNPTTALIAIGADVLHLGIEESTNDLVITTSGFIEKYDSKTLIKTDKIDFSTALNYEFSTNKGIINRNYLYVNTEKYGVLRTSLSNNVNYEEIHPEGPTGNDIFSITVSGNQKWVVYGGVDENNILTSKKSPIDYCIDDVWGSIPYNVFKTRYCTKAIVDPLDTNRVLVSTIRDGVLEFVKPGKEYVLHKKWVKDNTKEVLPGHESSNDDFVGTMILDKNNRIWTANSRAKLKKYFSSYNTNIENSKVKDIGKWELNVKLSSVTDKFIARFNKMCVDQNNVIYATSKTNSVLVFDANSLDVNRVSQLDNTNNHGALNSTFTYGIAVDESNKIWIGTQLGVSVIDDYSNLFSTTIKQAEPVIIEQGGVAKEFLSGLTVTDILIDAAKNKWFATNTGGVFYTSSDAQITYNQFTTSNSPLPSNSVLDLEIDKSTGLVYIVTEKGVVVYDPKTQPFGAKITEMVAYPNPAVRTSVGHDVITFVAKDGNGIPDGTNIKIVDISGRLVYEATILDNGQSEGGKFVWNKKNLRGSLVASGIYIVLFSNADGTENTTTKVAIVN